MSPRRDRPGLPRRPGKPPERPPLTTPRPGPTTEFDQLLGDHPVLFAPVRLETRFTEPGPGGTRHLMVRIYPDQFHVDDHDPRLTDREASIGRGYWKAWRGASTPDEREQARARLLAQLPPRRAAWAASATRSGTPQQTSDGPRPARVGLLPDRWAVIGFIDDDGDLVEAFRAWTTRVRQPLNGGVDPAADWSSGAAADPGLAWMTDYDAAVEAGMAVTVDLTDHQDVARDGLAVLLAVGVSSAAPEATAEQVTELLAAHHYSDGIAFLPQGTPTNNTDQVDSGWSAREADPAALLARELDEPVEDAGRNSNGRRFARALGLRAADLLTRFEHADEDEESAQKAMNRVLWPVTLGQYMDRLLAGVDSPSTMPAEAIGNLHSRFIDDVRGGAPLPCLRVGSQPYGLLPVRFSSRLERWQDTSPWFEHTVLALREEWLHAARTAVPSMDPVAGASGGTAANDPDSVLSEILSNLAHPRRFLVRRLRSWRTTDTESIDELGDVIVALLLPFLYFDDPVFDAEAFSVIGRLGWALEILGGADHLGLPGHELTPLYDAGLADADAQIAALQALRGRVATLLSGDDADSARAWLDSLIILVEQHRARQSPLLEIGQPTLGFSGVVSPDVDDPTIFYSVYDRDEDTEVFERPLTTSEHASPARYLGELRDRVPVSRPEVTPGTPDMDVLPSGPALQGVRGRQPGRFPIPAPPRRRRAPTVNLDVDPGDLWNPTTPGGTQRQLPAAFHDSAPLLYQLLDGVVADVPVAQAAAYRAALDTLAGQPADALELRLRETLGLASHRIDAFTTSMARRRLDALPGGRTGSHVGGYGWVIDLVPDKAGALDSQGFIHAPSMQQAATAAILRSGWSAHGSDEAASQMAVNLRSDRVRSAAWLLDGVRQGQALGDLLGYRFERGLHDDGAAAWIDPVRRAVLLHGGDARDPRGPVDGLALLELHAERPDPASLLSDVPAEYLPADPLTAAAVERHLDRTSDLLDAAGDAAIAESVHQVAQGNPTRAAATLDALNQGEVPPPELLGMRTPVTGTGVINRIVVLLGDEGPVNGWSTTTARARADGRLEAWVARLLGPADRIACRARWVDADGAVSGWHVLTLADLGVSALDAVAEAPPPLGTTAAAASATPTSRAASGAGGEWGRRLEARLRATTTVPASAAVEIAWGPGADADTVPMADVAELAGQLRTLIGRCRPLTARDLSSPESPAAGEVPLDVLAQHVGPVESGFRSRADALVRLLPWDLATAQRPRPRGDAAPGDLHRAMLAMSDYPLPGSVPVAGYTDDEDDLDRLWEAAWTLGVEVQRRVKLLDDQDRSPTGEGTPDKDPTGKDPTDKARTDQSPAAPGAVDPRTRLRRVWEVVLGRWLPPVVGFAPPADGPLGDDGAGPGFAATADLVGSDPAVVTDFVARAGMVRADVRHLDQALMLAELVRGGAAQTWAVAQQPHVDADPWVGRGAPVADTGGRVHWLAIDHRSPGGPVGVAHGLFVDEWVDRIPQREVTTGLAIHSDAPAARAPQSLLLGVTPDDDTPWSLDLVTATLLQVLEDATVRAVSPQALSALGHHLPAIFSPGRVSGDLPGQS